MASGGSNPSGSRLSAVLRTVPPVTQGVIAICVGIYLLQCLLDVDPTDWALKPARVIRSNEYYRVLTSPLLHLSPMHIGMNMMSTYAMSTMLEKRLGSLRILFIILSSIVATGTVHVIGAGLLSWTFGMHWLMLQSSVGFSGVLFHLSVLECNLGTHENRSVFGFFEVRATIYPWVLLIVLQVVMPNISFAGHLAGILAGTQQLHGCPTMTPSEVALRRLDDSEVLRRLTLLPSFVATTSVSMGHNSSSMSTGLDGCSSTVRQYVVSARQNASTTLFGRGHAENANIRLGRVDEEVQVGLIPKDASPELSQIV